MEASCYLILEDGSGRIELEASSFDLLIEVCEEVVQRGGGNDGDADRLRRLYKTKRKLPRPPWELEEIARREEEEKVIARKAPVIDLEMEEALAPVFNTERLSLEVIDRLLRHSTITLATRPVVVVSENAFKKTGPEDEDEDEILAALEELL